MADSPASVILSPELWEFGQRARALLRSTIEEAVQNDTRPNRDVVHWYVALGTLAWDVSGSVLLLLEHGEVRAATMLNRSLFEYWVRIRYYTRFPDKASEAIHQLPTRIGKIDAARTGTTMPDSFIEEERAEFESYLATGSKIERSNFRNDILEAVLPKDQADAYYDFFYGKASAWIHGYETMLADVLSANFHGHRNPNPDWQTRRFKADDTAGVCIHNVLDCIDEIRTARNLPQEKTMAAEWDELQRKLGV